MIVLSKEEINGTGEANRSNNSFPVFVAMDRCFLSIKYNKEVIIGTEQK